MTTAAGPGVADAGPAGPADPADLTRRLVRIPSVNPALSEGGQGEEAIARACRDWLAERGFRVRMPEVAPGRFNVVAEAGADPRSGGPLLVLNGHLDTVGVDGMTVAPFEPDTDDDARITGRGACDMKGGVAALMCAAATVVARGGPGVGTLVVALTADEEHASIGMQAFAAELAEALGPVQREVAAELAEALDPDRREVAAELAEALGPDRREVAAELAEAPDPDRREVAAVVCEPTGLAVMPAHKGFVWIETSFRGRAAHGSRPDVGIDAARHAGLWIAALEELHADLSGGPRHPLLGPPSFHVGTIRGGTAPSVYPAACRVTVERRTLPAEDPDRAVDPFRAALDRISRDLPDVDAELRVDLVRPGSDVPPEAAVVRGLSEALRAEGIEPRIEGMTAWVDAAFLNGVGVPSVCFGPGSIGHAHSADEHVVADEVRAAARVLERFADRFLRG